MHVFDKAPIEKPSFSSIGMRHVFRVEGGCNYANYPNYWDAYGMLNVLLMQKTLFPGKRANRAREGVSQLTSCLLLWSAGLEG